MEKKITIIIGGQTGVDRGALRAAVTCGYGHGGWCPPGRNANDGRIHDVFELNKIPVVRSYEASDIPRSLRTCLNVRDSNAVFVLSSFPVNDVGTYWAVEFARKLKKPFTIIDPGTNNVEQQI